MAARVNIDFLPGFSSLFVSGFVCVFWIQIRFGLNFPKIRNSIEVFSSSWNKLHQVRTFMKDKINPILLTVWK